MAVFQSDWAAFLLLIKELISHNTLSDYYMPPTPALFQIITYVLPFFLAFGISYKAFYYPILLQTFINVVALYFLLTKLFPFNKGIKPIIPVLILSLTLTGPLLTIIDAAMFRKDIPIILLSIYFLITFSKFSFSKIKYKSFFKIFLILSFLTVQAFGDPFVTYMILLPLFGISILYYFLNSKSTIADLSIAVYSFFCIISSSLFRIFTAKYLTNLYSETSNFITPEKLLSNFTVFLRDIDYLLPISGFLGNPIMAFSNIRFGINILILILLIISLITVVRHSLKTNNYFLFYIAVLPIFSSLTYIFSGRPGADVGTVRYHMILAYLFYICVFIFAELTRKDFKRVSYLIYIILIIHGIYNSVAFGNILIDQLTNFSSYNKLDTNQKLIDTLHTESLEKGFAGYWDSSSNTYYSRGAINIRPVVCQNGVPLPFYWFSFNSWYEQSEGIDSTFVFVDKSVNFAHTSGCDIDSMRKLFGLETKTVEFETNKFLYIWDYDISSKIPKTNILEKDLIKK